MDQKPKELKIGDIVTLLDGRKVELVINPLYFLGLEDVKSDCRQCDLTGKECVTPGFEGCCKAHRGTYFKWVEEDGTEDSQINVDR